MNIENAQQVVDGWIQEHGVRYFNELTNMAQLTEEVGEVARIIARRYGEQSKKESDKGLLLDNPDWDMSKIVEKFAELPKPLRKPLWKWWHKIMNKYDQRNIANFLNYGFDYLNEEESIHFLLIENKIPYATARYRKTEKGTREADYSRNTCSIK